MSDTRKCRVPGCGLYVRFLQVGSRVISVDVEPRPDGEFWVAGNQGYRVAEAEPPSDALRYGPHNAECSAWLRMSRTPKKTNSRRSYRQERWAS